MKRSPKGQLKTACSGEGPRGTIGGSAPTSGKRDAQFSEGTVSTVEGHTDSWQTGHKLKVKRNG